MKIIIILIFILSSLLWSIFYHPGAMLSVVSFHILNNMIIILILQIKKLGSNEAT